MNNQELRIEIAGGSFKSELQIYSLVYQCYELTVSHGSRTQPLTIRARLYLTDEDQRQILPKDKELTFRLRLALNDSIMPFMSVVIDSLRLIPKRNGVWAAYQLLQIFLGLRAGHRSNWFRVNTLAALLIKLRHIITIEDPIERSRRKKNQVVHAKLLR